MRIFHLADLHLGCRPPPATAGTNLREQDVLAALNAAAEAAIAAQAQVVTLGGDLFHMNNPPPHAVWALMQFRSKLTDRGIAVLGIQGNHDILRGWLDVAGVRDLDGDVTTVNGVRFAGLSYVHPGLFYERVTALVQQVGSFDVLLVHQAFAELCGFSGELLELAQLAPLVRPAGCSLVLMGDIHSRGTLDCGGVHFVYPGSIERISTNEPPDKAWYVYDMAGAPGAMTFVETVIPHTNFRQTLDFLVMTEEDYTLMIQRLAGVPEDPARSPILMVRYNADLPDAQARMTGALSRFPLVRLFPVVPGDRLVSQTQEGMALQDAADRVVSRLGVTAMLRDLLAESGMLNADGTPNNEATAIMALLGMNPDELDVRMDAYVDALKRQMAAAIVVAPPVTNYPEVTKEHT